jgi:hypothetical protein
VKRIDIKVSRCYICGYVLIDFIYFGGIELLENASSSLKFVCSHFNLFVFKISIELFKGSSNIAGVVVKSNDGESENDEVKDTEIE